MSKEGEKTYRISAEYPYLVTTLGAVHHLESFNPDCITKEEKPVCEETLWSEFVDLVCLLPDPQEIDLPLPPGAKKSGRKSEVNAALEKALLLNSGDYKYKRRVFNRAWQEVVRNGRPVSQQVERRLAKLARRYPNGPWKSYIPEEDITVFSLTIPTYQLPLHVFKPDVEKHPFNFEEAIVAGLFENGSQKLMKLVHLLSGKNYHDSTIMYPSKDLCFQMLGRKPYLPQGMLTYNDFLRLYEPYEEFILKRRIIEDVTVPIAQVKSDNVTILSMELLPPPTISEEVLVNIDQGRRKGDIKMHPVTMFYGGNFTLSSEVFKTTKEEFIDALKKL